MAALECDFVRFTLADFNGVSRGRYIPKSSVARFLEEGLGLHWALIAFGPRSQLPSQIPVYSGKAETSNVTSVAIPDTFHLLPWAGGKYKVGEVLCETALSPGEPQEACPRYLARKQISRLSELHGLTLWSGWEVEFMLLYQDTQQPLFKGCDYVSHLLFTEHEEFYLDMQKMLEDGGVEVEGMNNEYASGQMELITKPVAGIRGIDGAVNLKQAVKEISTQKGFQAVFMAKPYPELCGNGLHFNFSFRDEKNRNVFCDETSTDKLSEFGNFFIGGLMAHVKAITALFCPTVNCYRRVHQPWAPGKAIWGVDDRETCLRVKFGSSGPYLENRIPSSASNPYLVVAATIAAGLDGVTKKISPPPAMDQSPEELPHSLQEALQALEDDVVMREVLGAEFVNWFVTSKRSIDCEDLKDSDMKKTNPDHLDKEREMYIKFL